MGFLDDIVGTALGLNEFKNEVLSIKDELVSSVTDMGGDAKAMLDETIQTVQEVNPLNNDVGEE